MYGSGKFEPFDYDKMYQIRSDINSENFKFKVGESHELQNGDFVKIIGRTDLIGYECLICSDGRHRYDRSTGLIVDVDKGRVTGSSHEFLSQYNILNKDLGNRYKS